jgi:hypothetical protein
MKSFMKPFWQNAYYMLSTLPPASQTCVIHSVTKTDTSIDVYKTGQVSVLASQKQIFILSVSENTWRQTGLRTVTGDRSVEL